MQFEKAYKVPYAAIGGLLNLLQFLCPQPNLLPKTFYNVKQFFQQFNSNTIMKRFCCKCSSIVADGLNICKKCGIQPVGVGQFVHIPVS